jgi:hypothetical protein
MCSITRNRLSRPELLSASELLSRPELLSASELRQKFWDDPDLLFQVIRNIANADLGTASGRKIMEAAGRAAYEAFRKLMPGDLPLPWNAIPHALQAAWVAAAQAAIDTSQGAEKS